jgi:hypothetical protein
MHLVRAVTVTAVPRGTAVHTRFEGEDLVASDYWDGVLPTRGVLYCAMHAVGVALLVPPSLEHTLREMRTGREVIVTRGPWPERRQADAVELMWEDDSIAPFAVQLSVSQCGGLGTLSGDRPVLMCRVYIRGRDGGPQLAGTWRARFRRAESLPCLRPWDAAQVRGRRRSDPAGEEQRE